VNRRARRAKNDCMDADKLPAMPLRCHGEERRVRSVAVARAPTAQGEDARRVDRELQWPRVTALALPRSPGPTSR
jgi:hypothetical protein